MNRLVSPRMGTMDSFIINGGKPLKGKVEISGSQHASLPIMAAVLLTEVDELTRLHGVPRLSDIDSMTGLLGELGCHVYRHDPTAKTVGDGPNLNGPLDLIVKSERRSEARYEIV